MIRLISFFLDFFDNVANSCYLVTAETLSYDDWINKYFRTFCRDVVTSAAGVAPIHLKNGEDTAITLITEAKHEFGLAAVNLVRIENWDVSYLQQVGI